MEVKQSQLPMGICSVDVMRELGTLIAFCCFKHRCIMSSSSLNNFYIYLESYACLVIHLCF